MAVKIRRSYKGAAASSTLGSSGVTSATQTSIALSASPAGWPTGKFFVVVAPGSSQEEKMCVTISGSTLTVVDPAVTSTSASSLGRGADNTTARSAISGGSVVYPVFTAIDADEANELTSTYSAQGHLVYQGASTFAGLSIGTAGQVLAVNSGATAPEWKDISVVSSGIADGAVTTAKIADSAVTSAKIADGTIVNADISASAAIALSKLAPGALPTAITVASANIVDGTIATGDLADSAVTSAKIANATIVTGDIASGTIRTTNFDTTTAVASGGVPVITVSGSAPTGGKDGDIWIVV